MPNPHIARRSFLAAALAAPGVVARAAAPTSKKSPLCVFSKHFQWLNVPDAAALAAECGLDGLDLTVRAGGHVLPERVEDDLPKAIEAVHKAGLVTPMITTEILDPTTPRAENVIRTASSLGIRRYRWGPFRYDYRKPLDSQIPDFQARAKDLAALNKQYNSCAMYHTHSGSGNVGASMWDIWMVLHGLDNDAVSVNLDIGHATIEGGLGGWGNSSRLLLPISKGICLKDFYWAKNGAGKWDVRWCPAGDGMVNFAGFLKLVKASGFEGPVQMHMEYPELGGANEGHAKITLSRDQFAARVKHDVTFLRARMQEAGVV